MSCALGAIHDLQGSFCTFVLGTFAVVCHHHQHMPEMSTGVSGCASGPSCSTAAVLFVAGILSAANAPDLTRAEHSSFAASA